MLRPIPTRWSLRFKGEMSFPLPAVQKSSGTRCQMNLEILTASIVLNGFWKQYSLAASVTSALEVIFVTRCAIQIYVLLTYLLSVPTLMSSMTHFSGHCKCYTTLPSCRHCTPDFCTAAQLTAEYEHRDTGRRCAALATTTKQLWRWWQHCRQSLFTSHVGFLPARRYASAGLCDSDVSVCPSVRPSVCPSHAGIVPSRAKAGSWNVHHLIAPWL